MVRSFTHYQGQLRCSIRHEPSGNTIHTDAPKDNHGRGETFSPTDLVAAALASCVVTTIAIVAERDGVPFESASATVEKHMGEKPRRIEMLRLQVTMPASLSPQLRKKYEEVAHHCPVHRSLSAEMKIPIEFVYV